MLTPYRGACRRTVRPGCITPCGSRRTRAGRIRARDRALLAARSVEMEVTGVEEWRGDRSEVCVWLRGGGVWGCFMVAGPIDLSGHMRRNSANFCGLEAQIG